MKKTIFLTLLSFLLVSFCGVGAFGQDNIIRHGGFEEFVQGSVGDRPAGWVVTGSIFPQKVEGGRPGSSGQYHMLVYANGGNFYTQNTAEEPNVRVEQGKVYRLSFWHKGNKTNIPIRVRVTWYEDDTYRERSKDFDINTKTTWVQEEIYVRAPEGTGVNRGEVGFAVRMKSGGQIAFDDVEMHLFEGEIPEPLVPPTNIRVKSYQRELEVTWDPSNDPKVTWEISVNGRPHKGITTNRYTIEKLNPSTPYLVTIRAIRGDKESDPSVPMRYTTAAYERALDAADRVPYLRTIEPDGNIKQRKLRPYFNDLGTNKAIITYTIDGKAVELVDGELLFDTLGYHHLVVSVDEGGGKKWKLTYRVYVLK